MTTDAAVRELLAAEIERHAGDFKSFEVPKKLLVVEENFTTDNDMLTPTLKIKRRNVLQRWAPQLEALYREEVPPPAAERPEARARPRPAE